MMGPYGGPPPPPFVQLQNNSGQVPPPPYRRSIPRYNHDQSMHKQRGGCSWLKCLCCCCCLILILILVLAGLAIFFFIFYQPQVPHYNVEHFQVKSFAIHPDFSLDTEFLVIVKAENPNTDIGFMYLEGSSVDVIYKNSTMCDGKLPEFTQGTKNTTMIKIDLNGKSKFGKSLQEGLVDSQAKGSIPLLVKVKVPVQIMVSDVALRKIQVSVDCHLVVDNLSPNKKVGIVSSKYDVNVEF